MAWKIKGQYFENCSCDVPCPCTVSLDFGADRDPATPFSSSMSSPVRWTEST